LHTIFISVNSKNLTPVLQPGPNALGVQVLYYGHGDGTWPAGKPGLLCRLEIELADGSKQVIASGNQWRAHYARAWRPGQFKRWYLRAFQVAPHELFCRSAGMLPAFGRIRYRKAGLETGAPSVRFKVSRRVFYDVVYPS
jgi:hypothetical protein